MQQDSRLKTELIGNFVFEPLNYINSTTTRQARHQAGLVNKERNAMPMPMAFNK